VQTRSDIAKSLGELQGCDQAEVVRWVNSACIWDIADKPHLFHDEGIWRRKEHIVNAVLWVVAWEGVTSFRTIDRLPRINKWRIRLREKELDWWRVGFIV
jgi:hypothetical protein